MSDLANTTYHCFLCLNECPADGFMRCPSDHPFCCKDCSSRFKEFGNGKCLRCLSSLEDCPNNYREQFLVNREQEDHQLALRLNHELNTAPIRDPPSQPPPPPMWGEYYDARTQRMYYHNHRNNTTTWEPPPANVPCRGALPWQCLRCSETNIPTHVICAVCFHDK